MNRGCSAAPMRVPPGSRGLCLAAHPDSAARVLGARLVRDGRTLYSVPDTRVMATVDVRPWLGQKVGAVVAHRSEVQRGALPGRLAALPAAEREALLSTEWCIRRGSSGAEGVCQTELTV
ncbi:hypothetical protein GCM10009564_46220 [Streptomyces thermogriseus]|uniref:Uncharacterized protein n=2 Tax=Streptomyces TaxID=1883 RepID=A0ABP4DMN5_9ACTN